MGMKRFFHLWRLLWCLFDTDLYGLISAWLGPSSLVYTFCYNMFFPAVCNLSFQNEEDFWRVKSASVSFTSGRTKVSIWMYVKVCKWYAKSMWPSAGPQPGSRQRFFSLGTTLWPSSDVCAEAKVMLYHWQFCQNTPKPSNLQFHSAELLWLTVTLTGNLSFHTNYV